MDSYKYAEKQVIIVKLITKTEQLRQELAASSGIKKNNFNRECKSKQQF